MPTISFTKAELSAVEYYIGLAREEETDNNRMKKQVETAYWKIREKMGV